jgi:hypothetical protein
VLFDAIQRLLGFGVTGNLGTFAQRGAFSAVTLLGATGCMATVQPEPVTLTYEYDSPVVEASVVPIDIRAYPRVYYSGGYVYLVDGRWYYPTARGWMIYRDEPRELRHYRAQVERSPRYRPPPTVYAYPQERRRERTPR